MFNFFDNQKNPLMFMMNMMNQENMENDAGLENELVDAELMELLKQPIGHPRSMSDQVITLTVVNSGVIDTVPVDMAREFMADYLDKVHAEEQTIGHDVELGGTLNDDEKYFLVQKAQEQLTEFMSIRE